jgi:hypothetical protein
MLEVQYSIKVKVFECDNEITEIHPQVAELLTARGIRAEPSAPNTQAQNGGAERIAAVIILKSRAMRAGAKLPEYLWPESIKAATYLYNRTPSIHRNRKTPYELFHRQFRGDHSAKPDLSHLRAYGCKVFALTADAQLRRNRLQRQAPRAWIGFLVGYTSSNSFRVWNPLHKEVFTTRDVSFNEQQLFDGRTESLRDDLRQQNLEAIRQRIEELVAIQAQAEQWLSQPPDEEADEVIGEDNDDLFGEHSPSNCEAVGKVPESEGAYEYTTAKFEPLPTPPLSPPAAFFHTLASGLGVKGRGEAAKHELEAGTQYAPNKNKESSAYQLANRQSEARKVQSDLADRPAKQRESFKAAFLAGRLQSPKHRTSNRRVFGEGLASPRRALGGGRQVCPQITKDIGAQKPPRLESPASAVAQKPLQMESPVSGGERPPCVNTPWRLLQTLPSSHATIASHPYREALLEAERIHLQSHADSQSWIEVAKASAKGRRVLGCHWVYVYKLDKHGRFVKIKARLVIRGDQQAIDGRETYAATLAGMSFRTLMALANRFDYDMLQYDAVNAFVHAKLDEDIYMQMPAGYRKPGRILKLQKALYGLRRSPLLWQKHFEKGLLQAGFRRVPGEDCCWLHGDIIFFFYVDDCVLCFPKRIKSKAMSLMAELQTTYNIEGGKPLQWFLGIEVIRDRRARKLWLSQAVYIDKMRRLLPEDSPNLTTVTPMIREELLPHDTIASPSSVNLYLRKVGTIMYAAVMTRPDIAFAASRLARFNQNPGPQQQRAADRALQYLIQTKGLCLEYGAAAGSEEDGLQVASDASFADNSTDRRSSQAFVMKLFGGITSWRANKQDTVTTSTTEAELLALSQAAKEALFASRLISALKVDLNSPTARRAAATPARITIECDNKQTIRLVTAELVQLRTKLKHVDIHNHWLRQEIIEERVNVIYTPTTRMLADGLTKNLSGDGHSGFLKQLKLIDLTDKIEQRRTEERAQEL